MRRLITLLLVGLWAMLPIVASAGPRIDWSLYNKEKKCWDECVRRAFGHCVEWRTRCDNRTANWEDFHRNIVKAAMDRISARIDSEAVKNCTRSRRRVSYGVSAQQSLDDANALRVANYWPRIHIHAYRETTKFFGQAYAERNVWGDGQTLFWNKEPHIDINLSAMESALHQNGFDYTANKTAGTIIHELLHQMGHDHPHGYDDGNFMTTLDMCITHNGNPPAANLAGIGFSLYGPK